MKNKKLLLHISVIALFALGNIYCSEQASASVGASGKRGVKRSASKKVLSKKTKKKRINIQKDFDEDYGAEGAIITYKHLHCTEPKDQARFFQHCKANGWKRGELEGFAYAIPEGYGYCPLREKTNCPYLMTNRGQAVHMKKKHKAEHDAEFKVKAESAASRAAVKNVPKKKLICSICNKELAHKQGLDMHFKRCSRGNKCSVCDKQCKNPQSLALHSRVHRNEQSHDQLQSSQSAEPAVAEMQQPPTYAQATEGVPAYSEHPFAVPSSEPEPKQEPRGPLKGADLTLPMHDIQ